MYVADTHSFLWFLTNDDKLGQRAKEIFRLCDQGKEIIAVPSIVLLECLYVCEKKKVNLEFKEIFLKIRGTYNYVIYPLDEEVILECESASKIKDPHDRILISTAKILDAILITKDSEIKNSGLVETMW